MSQRDIERVLAGDDDCDDFHKREQAVIRAAEWDQGMAERRAALYFEEEFTAGGESWSEADAYERDLPQAG